MNPSNLLLEVHMACNCLFHCFPIFGILSEVGEYIRGIYMNKLISGLLILAFAVVSGCSEESKVEPTTSAAPAQEEQVSAQRIETVADKAEAREKPVVEALAIGATGTLGEWEFSLKDFKVQDEVKSDYSRYVPQEGMKYIVLNFDVKNNGTTEALFVDYEDKATLFYQDKYEYERADLVLDGSLSAYGLKPLEEATGFLTFPVPEKVAADTEGNFSLIIEKNGGMVKYDLQ